MSRACSFADNISSVAEGRNIDLVTLPGHPTQMAVIEITVRDAFEGEVGDTAYFEFIRGGASAELLADGGQRLQSPMHAILRTIQ
jgi:hypothetical protein